MNTKFEISTLLFRHLKNKGELFFTHINFRRFATTQDSRVV
jgi:hypothetical protein